jgi:hypothetical protein
MKLFFTLNGASSTNLDRQNHWIEGKPEFTTVNNVVTIPHNEQNEWYWFKEFIMLTRLTQDYPSKFFPQCEAEQEAEQEQQEQEAEQ